jgi:hypothetical protein
MIAILLERKEWNEVLRVLEELRGKVADSELAIQVEQAKKRLMDGMQHAKSI